MGTITFDTLSFTRKLRDAGFDERQAEAVVRVMAKQIIGVRPRLMRLSPSPQSTEDATTPRPASHKGAGFLMMRRFWLPDF